LVLCQYEMLEGRGGFWAIAPPPRLCLMGQWTSHFDRKQEKKIIELRKIPLFVIDIASIMLDDRVIDGIHSSLTTRSTISDMGNSRWYCRPAPPVGIALNTQC